MTDTELTADELKARELDQRKARAAAIRDAVAIQKGEKAEPTVEVRVTQFGEGQISTGEHVPRLGDLTYVADERPTLPVSVAQSLAARGLVEIARKPAAKPGA